VHEVRGEEGGQRGAEDLVLVVIVVQRGGELGHGSQGSCGARWCDIEALHQATLLLTVLLATTSCGQRESPFNRGWLVIPR